MTAPAPAVRRYIECAAYVGIWMACGWALPVNANEYLLLGVPLLAVLQLGVRRRPLHELWVRDAPSFALRWPAPVFAVAIAGLPVFELGSSMRTGQLGSSEAWLLCCFAGAGLAAFAIREQRLEALRRAFPALRRLRYGALTVRMYQGKESQLTTFSVPSNSAAILPPPALYENFLM